MKKLILLVALCAPLLFTQCKEKQPTTDYTVKVNAAGAPVKAQLMFMDGQERKVDSVEVVNNAFEFKGTTEEPKNAMLFVYYQGEEGMQPPMTRVQLFLEPGTINVEVPEDLNQPAKVTGTKINDESAKWNEINKDAMAEMTALQEWFYGLPREERNEENMQKAMDTEKGIMERIKTNAESFIKTNPDSWFAMASLYDQVAGNDQDPVAAQAVLDQFTPRLKETTLGKEKQAQIDAWKATAIGAMAPEFTQNDPDGNPIKLADLRGQWVLIDFWASWCGPCRGENPHVVAAFDKFKGKGFTVFGVSLDDNKENWLKAIEDDKLAWPQVSDLKGWGNEAAKMYAVRGIPANFLLDPQGKIVAKNLRGAALEEELAKHLN